MEIKITTSGFELVFRVYLELVVMLDSLTLSYELLDWCQGELGTSFFLFVFKPLVIARWLNTI